MTLTKPPFTLRSRVGLDTDRPTLSGSLLVVIDAQREYGPDGDLELPGLAAAVENIAVLLDRARSLGGPIIHVVHRGPAGGLFDPAVGGRVLPEVLPLETEEVVEKRLPNAFAGTDLLQRIERFATPPLVIAGFMTHMCVSSTARAALDLGLSTTVASDASATRSLPDPSGGDAISADVLHRSALAALADRFSTVATTETLLS